MPQHHVPCCVVGAENFLPLQHNTEHDVVAQNFMPQQPSQQNEPVENFQPLRSEFQKMIPRSIGSIVKGFKIGVTKWFRNNADASVGVENVVAQNFVPQHFQPLRMHPHYFETILLPLF